MESVKIDWRNFSTSGGPNSHTHGPLMVTRMVVLATFCSFRLGHAKSGRFVGSWGTIYNKLMWDEQIFKETPFWGEDFQSKWHPENNWILFTKSKKKVHNTQPAECPHIYDKLYRKSTTFFNICWNSWAFNNRQKITPFLYILQRVHNGVLPPTSWFFIPQLKMIQRWFMALWLNLAPKNDQSEYPWLRCGFQTWR